MWRGWRRHAHTHDAGGADALELAPYVPSSKLRSARQATGDVPAAATATVSVPWRDVALAGPLAFADTAYTVTGCVVVDVAGGAGLRLQRVEGVAAASVSVRVTNDGLTARGGTIHADARHD